MRNKQRSSRAETVFHNVSDFCVFITRFRAVVAIIICSLLSLFFNSYSFKDLSFISEDTVSGFYSAVSSPFHWAKSKLDDLRLYDEVLAENKDLKLANTKASEMLNTIAKLELENQQLKDLLNYTGYINYRYISARVVSAALDELGTTIMINAGTEDGIKDGYPVLSGFGAIGRVISVSKRSARVLLFTNGSSKIPVRLFHSKISCIAIGNAENGTMKMLYVEQSNNNIMENDIVFTSGEGSLIPYGLYVGSVVSKNGDMIIKPTIDYNDMEVVKILLPEKEFP